MIDNLANKRQYLYESESVTLDGKPAKICGWCNNFATITTLDRPHVSFEWSWPTVARIVANGGHFKS